LLGKSPFKLFVKGKAEPAELVGKPEIPLLVLLEFGAVIPGGVSENGETVPIRLN